MTATLFQRMAMAIGVAFLLGWGGFGAAQADIRPLMRPVDVGVTASLGAVGRVKPDATTAVVMASLAPDAGLRPRNRPREASAPLAVDPVLLTAVARLFDMPQDWARAPVAVALPSGAISVAEPDHPGWEPSVLAPQFLAGAAARAPVLSVSTSGMAVPSVRPRVRPDAAVVGPAVMAVPLARAFRPEPRPALQRSPKPEAEAEVVPVAVVRVLPGKAAVFGKKGSVCGDPSIKGQTIAPIIGRIKGCGVPEAVMVTSVSGVMLSEPATIDCNTARALDAWVEQGLQPQFANDPVVQLQVAGHYVCRPRNNIAGNKISEHGRGKAIDISGFVLASGEVLRIATDWRSKADGRLIKAAHKAACGVFNTTLGPGSDGYHEDHLHFDTASGRGPYCR